jgi:hypothetical protein
LSATPDNRGRRRFPYPAKRAPRQSEVAPEPFEERRENKLVLARHAFHLRTVDESGGGPIELFPEVPGIIDGKPRTETAGAGQSEVNARIKRIDDVDTAEITVGEGLEKTAGLALIGPQNAEPDVVGGKNHFADIVTDAAEETRRPARPQHRGFQPFPAEASF